LSVQLEPELLLALGPVLQFLHWQVEQLELEPQLVSVRWLMLLQVPGRPLLQQ